MQSPCQSKADVTDILERLELRERGVKGTRGGEGERTGKKEKEGGKKGTTRRFRSNHENLSFSRIVGSPRESAVSTSLGVHF